MSTTIDFDTVTHAIASLSISGVTIKDTHEMVDSLGLAYAVLCPRPDNFVTNLAITPANINKTALDVNYTLNYEYYHCQVAGGLGGLFGDYAPMLDKLALIIQAFSDDASLSGAVDNGECVIGQISIILDAAGNKYHGCDISINILQFLEV